MKWMTVARGQTREEEKKKKQEKSLLAVPVLVSL